MQLKGNVDLSRFLILFSFGILAGCVYMNCLWRLGAFFDLNERKMVMDLLYESETYKKFWELSIMALSALIYLFTLFSGFTQMGVVLSGGLCFVMGIWWGAFVTEYMISKGLSSLVYVLKMMVPECFLFILSYASCLIWVNNMSTMMTGRKRNARKNAGKYGKILVLSIGLYVVWFICSLYVNQIVEVKINQ